VHRRGRPDQQALAGRERAPSEQAHEPVLKALGDATAADDLAGRP
jgi:hypothetical protein